MIKFAPIILSLACLSACAPDHKPAGFDQAASKETSAVARIDGVDIAMEAVDAPIQLGLYDLEWEKYQLRRASLKRMISDNGGPAEIFLKPPEPPRLIIDLQGRPLRGAPDAPVILSVFCSYQSSHCARLQPVLNNLRAHYGEALSLAYFDFPQGYHRYGTDAALAVRCAFDQTVSWDFADSVSSAFDDLNFRRFELLASQSGIDQTSFKSCYDAREFVPAIQDDIEYSRSLGFSSVPIVLVNGLYIKGPRDEAVYRFYIDQELTRLGVSLAEKAEHPDKEDDQNAPEEINDDDPPQTLGYDRVRTQANTPPRDKSEITLSRAWLSDQLRNEDTLKAHFYKGDHKPSGFAVLKLGDISGNAFFETLGLKTGDVILQVNGEWVHEGQNGLWTELRYSDDVEIKLMRRGKPVTYYYRMGD